MVVRIGSNILSLNVQRQLGRASDDLSSVTQRLSSGQRINRASDDAAGLAISTTLKVNSKVLQQGIRNLNDGLSAVNIAESAMESLGSVADRIQELTTQAMSGTFGDKQRESMQREVTALQSEWNRIVESTSFNGTNLLTGSNTRTVLQGGAGVAGTLAVQIGEAQLTNGLEGYAGGTTRVSTDSAGNEAMGGGSSVTAISADGRYVAFSSAATNLVAGDTNGQQDGFIKDTVTGVTTRVSTDSTGNQVTGGASNIFAISADGRYVAFNSLATNLVAGDTNSQLDVFIKDTITGVTTRVSNGIGGVQAKDIVTGTAMSADGRYVTFYAADGADLGVGEGNGRTDSLIKDTVTGSLTVVSTSTAGSLGNGNSLSTAISANGRYVAFWSTASNLVAGDTGSLRDAFIKDTVTGVTTRVSTDSAGNQASGSDSRVYAISADGRYVAFNSVATNLVAGDTNSSRDSFIKDTATGVTTRISTDSAGNQATGGDSYVTAISADGRYVAFYSFATNLVAGDTNATRDSFIKDTATGVTTRISTDSAGNEGTGGFSTVTALSADGRIAAFHSSATNLVAGDTNTQSDVFLRDLTRTGVQQLSGLVISNRVSAGVSLNLIQKYKDEITKYRSNLGATTSRISTFVNTLHSANINTLAADSRISDADIAQDAATAVAAQIRQQVAASLLGQANQAPQIALKLLQNA